MHLSMVLLAICELNHQSRFESLNYPSSNFFLYTHIHCNNNLTSELNLFYSRI